MALFNKFVKDNANSLFGIQIKQMMAEVKADDPIFWPSIFWDDLIIKNVRMIEAEGIENFKRTVSQNYFNWFIEDQNHPLFQHVAEAGRRKFNWMARLTTLRDTDRLRLTTDPDRQVVSPKQKEAYRLYVSHIWSTMMKLDRHNLRRRLREPAAGNLLG